jgi:hypothetical protein
MIKIILVKKSSQTAEKQSKGDKSDTHLACFKIIQTMILKKSHQNEVEN